MEQQRRRADFTGFVRARGAEIVDGAGRPLLLRGMGIGNWLLPEGYMWKLSPGAESPRQIEQLISSLVGPDRATQFWAGFRDAFFGEEDVRRIAELGFDHIRLPINARGVQDDQGAPIEEGLLLIDKAIEWCRTHGLWLLLDLHGAPGGQTGTNIDDSPNLKPELFMDAAYRDRTIRLWETLARRYRDETVVMGYDLLNEPLPNAWQHLYRDELVALYRDLTRAIRAIDTRHMLVYEGSHWATNWEIFTEVWDSNSALQFHRYWCPPDLTAIEDFLAKREELGLPIYMGEGGENNLEWLFGAFRLYEAHNIGWNFWPWKKIDTLTSPMSIVPPAGWEQIVAFANGGPKPSPSASVEILSKLVDAMRAANCQSRDGVVAAITARSPSSIPAWAFGYRGEGVSFKVSNGTPGLLRQECNVPIVLATGGSEPNFDHVDGRPYAHNEELAVAMRPGDWLEFEAREINSEAIHAVGPKGTDVDISVARTDAGFRVTAIKDCLLVRLLTR